MALHGSLSLSVIVGIVALGCTSAFPARWMFKGLLQNRDRPSLLPELPSATTARRLVLPGGCPNTGDPCSAVLQYGSIQPGSTSAACAGTGSGSTYLPATCQFTNATLLSSQHYMLNGSCALSRPGWPATVGAARGECWKAEQRHSASRPRSLRRSTTRPAPTLRPRWIA